jgi:hypothetical protein
MKATLTHWFSKIFEKIHNIDYHTLRRQLNYSSSRKASETIITLAFVCCENNPNILVSKKFGNNHHIGFRSLRKQFNYISFYNFGNDLNISLCTLREQLKCICLQEGFSQPFKAMRYVLCHVSWPNTRTITTCRPLAQIFLQSRRSQYISI